MIFSQTTPRDPANVDGIDDDDFEEDVARRSKFIIQGRDDDQDGILNALDDDTEIYDFYCACSKYVLRRLQSVSVESVESM